MNNFLSNVEAILIALLPLSIFVERLVEAIKKLICLFLKKDEVPPNAKLLVSIIISVSVCIILEIQVNYGFGTAPMVNEIITGVILSGGSNFVHAILSAISSTKKKNEIQIEEQDSIKTLSLSGVVTAAESLQTATAVSGISNKESIIQQYTAPLIQTPIIKHDTSSIQSPNINDDAVLIKPTEDYVQSLLDSFKDLSETEKEKIRRYWDNN